MARATTYGSNTRTALIPETTYGTNPGSGAQEIFLDSLDIEYQPNHIFGQTLVDTSQNYLKLGNEQTTVNMTGKLFKSSVAWHIIINRLFKKGTTVGLSDPYTHPYTIDYETAPGSFTLESIPHGGASSILAQQVLGCVPQTLTLTANQGEHPTFECTCIGREFTRSTGPGTAYTAANDTTIFEVGSLMTESITGGTFGNGLKISTSGSDYFVKPVNFEVTIESGIDDNAFTLDSKLRRQIQRSGNLAVSGTLDFYLESGETWTANQIQALIRTAQEFSFIWGYQTGTPSSAGEKTFQLNLGDSGAGVVFDPDGAVTSVEGPGVVLVSAPFQMLDVENNLTLEIVNDKASGTVAV